jgi:hypothetical protein
MASIGSVVSVTTAATLLWQTSTGVAPDAAIGGQVYRAGQMNDPVPVLVRNEDTTNAVTLCGLAGVAGVGPSLRAGESLTFNPVGNDSLYAISASATVDVSVLVQRQ